MEFYKKISIISAGKSRNNYKYYNLRIPNEIVKELEIDKDNRNVKITLENNKIIVEKIEK